MKKIIALLITMILVFSMASALALNWKTLNVENSTYYNIQADKYEVVNSDLGTAFIENSNAVAKKHGKVYFSLSVRDKNNNDFDGYELFMHDLEYTRTLSNGLHEAKVTGDDPYIQVKITEKTDMNELYFGSDKVTVNGNTVQIGELTFTRVNNIVTDVMFNGTALELTRKLNELEMTLEDVYGGRIVMSDEVLLRNFGKICETEKIVSWKDQSATVKPVENMVLPKTGDAPITAAIVGVCVILGFGVFFAFLAIFRMKR